MGEKLPPPHDIATQTHPLYIGVAESVQSADAEHVVTTAAVATMVLLVQGTVKDIAVGSATGAVDTHARKRQCLDEEVRARSAGTLNQLDYFSKLLDTTTKGDSIPPKFFSNCNDTLNGQRNASIRNRWKHTLAGRT